MPNHTISMGNGHERVLFPEAHPESRAKALRERRCGPDLGKDSGLLAPKRKTPWKIAPPGKKNRNFPPPFTYAL